MGSQTENMKWNLGKFETESHWFYTYRQFHVFRLGGGPNDYKDVIEHKFFESINFDDLLAKKVRNFLTIDFKGLIGYLQCFVGSFFTDACDHAIIVVSLAWMLTMHQMVRK